MIQEFLLPDLGEGLPEAELVQWLVAEGDEVTLNQTIAEVETAKAVVELPSPYAGTVRSLHAAEGEVVAVGSALIAFDVAGADAGEVDSTETPAEERATPNLVGYGAAPRSNARPQRRARGAAGVTAVLDTAVLDTAVLDTAVLDKAVLDSTPDEPLTERPRSTPPVRRLAKDLGVDLALVAASGAAEVITRADVEAYAARAGAASPNPSPNPSQRSPHAPTVVAASGRDRRIPIRGVRRHTAEAMVRSAFTAPHVTTFHTVDVTATSELIASLRADRALDGHRIGVLAIAAYAVCRALGRTPALNSAWDEEHGEIVEYGDVNLGIAAATARGLVVPNVRRAGELSLVELADAIGELADAARAGRTAPGDMRGGTFSITNIGVFGIEAGTPILNPGEAGILAVGAVQRRPWEHNGEVALRDVMTLSLSFDHRLADGAEAARFLRDVAGILAEPGRAMLLR